MVSRDLNIIVCVDPARCLHRRSYGRNGDQLLEDLQQLVRQQGYEDRVQVTPCRCIFGCTYGPRIDVARRWSGEKLLYGTTSGKSTISRRGTVEFSEIPPDLLELVQGNLPSGVAVPALKGDNWAQKPGMGEAEMIRQILEECQKGLNGVGFNEVVLMVSNTVSTAEVYMMFDDLRFTDQGDVVTFMTPEGTHLHMYMDLVREVEFIHRNNEQGLPSYSVWFKDGDQEPILRIYLRKSDNEETNQPRHDLFMKLMDKYGSKVTVGG